MINHKRLISDNYVEKLALPVAKISQDFNKKSTSEKFFFPLLAWVSADFENVHLTRVTNLSAVFEQTIGCW
jgi:hypothetical protein